MLRVIMGSVILLRVDMGSVILQCTIILSVILQCNKMLRSMFSQGTLIEGEGSVQLTSLH